MDSGGRKRTSERELTKDNAFDEGDEGAGQNGTGSFLRADDSVIATRRIVKAKRPPTAGGAAVSGGAAGAVPAAKPTTGLFSGFGLINQQQPPLSPAPATVGDSETGGGGEGGKESAELDPGPARGWPVPPMPDPEVEEGPPTAAEADVTSDPETDDDEITSVPKKAAGQAPDDGKEKIAGEAPKKENPREGSAANEDAGEASLGEGVKPASGAPAVVSVDGFAKLSSAPNAFATPFGSTASSPFSFGISPSAGGNASTPSVSPNPGATSGQSTFPSLSAVFGASNGAKVQLFGAAVLDGSATGTLPAATGAAPAVTLPAVDVVTGEEEEKALFHEDASLFEFVEGGKWKERGKGEVRLNAPQSDSRPARLVMRAKGNLRLLLNANLFPEMKVSRMDGRGLSFACVNSIEEKGEGVKASLSTLALRFKDEANTSKLLQLVEDHKDHKVSGEGEKVANQDATNIGTPPEEGLVEASKPLTTGADDKAPTAEGAGSVDGENTVSEGLSK